MNISYETEVFNIYDPKFSDAEFSGDSDEWSRISIDNEDEMNAKNDPLFDAHSIEEIKIYSDYSRGIALEDNEIELEVHASPIEPKVSNFVESKSPKVKVECQQKMNEDGISIDKSHQMSTTMPSFNFSFKNKKNEGMSLLYNSRKYDQTSKDAHKSKYEQCTIDSIYDKFKIPEECSDNFHLNTSTPTQSRNVNIFDSKLKGEGDYYSKFLQKKYPKPMTRSDFYADAISEYSVKTPTYTNLKREKITRSLNKWKKILKTGKDSIQLSKRSWHAKKGSPSLNMEIESKEDMVANLFKKTPNNYKRLSGPKTDYKTLAQKKKTIRIYKGKDRKVRKSEMPITKHIKSESKLSKKTRVKYSVYLNQNQSSMANDRQFLEKQ
jgi:hypothetical protein